MKRTLPAILTLLAASFIPLASFAYDPFGDSTLNRDCSSSVMVGRTDRGKIVIELGQLKDAVAAYEQQPPNESWIAAMGGEARVQELHQQAKAKLEAAKARARESLGPDIDVDSLDVKDLIQGVDYEFTQVPCVH